MRELELEIENKTLLDLVKTFKNIPFPCHDYMTTEQWTAICSICADMGTISTPNRILAVAKAALKRHKFKPGWDLFGLEVPLDEAIESLTQEEINLLEGVDL